MAAADLLVCEIRARAGKSARVRLPALWCALSEAVGSTWPGDRRGLLRQLLDEAAGTGSILLPGAKSEGWDRAGQPWLPPYVTIPGAQSAPPKLRRAFHPWSRELAFLEDAPSLAGEAEWLAIDGWIKGGGREAPAVPLRERSWEIFGDEKLAEKRVLSRKPFRDGNLDWQRLLRCFDTPEPLAPQDCPQATGRPVLVVENAAAFHSFSAWNRNARLWSAVAYGRGNSFATSWAALPQLCAARGTDTVLYAGDIDRAGIRIPISLLADFAHCGLVFQPCAWIYRELLSCSNARHAEALHAWDLGAGDGWFPQDLSAALSAFGARGWKMPQEAFGTAQLQRLKAATAVHPKLADCFSG